MKTSNILFLLFFMIVISSDSAAQSSEFTMKLYANSYLNRIEPIPWFSKIYPNSGTRVFDRFSLGVSWKNENYTNQTMICSK